MTYFVTRISYEASNELSKCLLLNKDETGLRFLIFQSFFFILLNPAIGFVKLFLLSRA